MKLLFKQRFFSWFDSYDIYDENGNTLYTVKGQLDWGHCLKIYDAADREVGTVKEEILTFLPKFNIYNNQAYLGCIRKEFSFFVPRFTVEFNGWQVEGDFFEWDYTIQTAQGAPVATVSKELFQWTDTYVIDVNDPADALYALMLVLAIDAEKCSRD
ncbi:MAG: LURP-one-related family protein [Clostridia bacterium]|nr:LURP-one-related family protein [Clostridia bacterium]MBQ5820543.1 LURP-one-related family protein [Clostridia bacterium]